MRFWTNSVAVRVKADDTGGPPGHFDFSTDNGIREYLLRVAGAPQTVINEIQSMPDEIREHLLKYWQLFVDHGFDSRQVAVFREQHQELNPLFDKYADRISRRIITEWKGRQ